MGRPGYYLATLDADGEPTLDVSASPPTYAPIPSGSLVTFPVAGRWGGVYGTEESDLAYETERGRRWVYKQFKRRVQKITFRVSEAQLADFKTLHDAVGGQRDPFIFVPDVSAPTVRIFCRKEKDFMPVQLEGPGYIGGAMQGMYDYTLEISEEPASVTIAV